MKLKPGADFTAVSKICRELAGNVTGQQRFSGLCNTPINTVRAMCHTGAHLMSNKDDSLSFILPQAFTLAVMSILPVAGVVLQPWWHVQPLIPY
jgi:hypothetical protein